MLSEEQMKNRMSGVGASEIACLMGEDCFGLTPYKLWRVKSGLDVPDQLDSDCIWWGNSLEPLIIEWFERKYDVKLETTKDTLTNSNYVHMLCHLDAFTDDYIVEIKTARYSREWGEPGTDEVPVKYIYQVQHQMAVTGHQNAKLVAFFSHNDIRVYDIKRDEDIIVAISNAVIDFWSYVDLKLSPPTQTIEDCVVAYRDYREGFIEATHEGCKALDDLMTKTVAYNAISSALNDAKKKVMDIIGHGSGMLRDGVVVVSWKPNKNGVRSFRVCV